MPKNLSLQTRIWFLFFVMLALNSLVWVYLRHTQAKWLNVPPLPSDHAVYASSLGDGQLAYRSIGVMLQNLGDMGGRTTSLRDYNYDDLAKWMFLMDRLDPKSDYIPYIASFYYGGVDDKPESLRPLVNYLYTVGNSDQGQKWRWLAHAVYLARFKVKDQDTAYKMALDLAKLANRPDSKLPNWARQMPAFIMNAKGDKQAALAIMVEILASVGDKLHPNEVNHTRGYICEQILTPEEAANNKLCEGDF